MSEKTYWWMGTNAFGGKNLEIPRTDVQLNTNLDELVDKKQENENIFSCKKQLT